MLGLTALKFEILFILYSVTDHPRYHAQRLIPRRTPLDLCPYPLHALTFYDHAFEKDVGIPENLVPLSLDLCDDGGGCGAEDRGVEDIWEEEEQSAGTAEEESRRESMTSTRLRFLMLWIAQVGVGAGSLARAPNVL